ncbi:MAG TPA: cation:proton antiporter [Gaiellales bacterium]|nr:cation:proton antiporter [Gaiellales bacterium]
MGDLHFTGLLIVAAVAFTAPLLLGLVPALRLPSVVVELVAGILIGPSVLGWVDVDEPVRVLSLVGLAFLLFLAGLEVEFERLRGRNLRSASVGFALSFAIAVVVGLVLAAAGQVDTPLLVAVILVATSLGVVIPVLKDADQISSDFGQLVIAAASIADFGAVILLSLFFSGESSSTGAKVILLSGFGLVAAALVLALMRAARLRRLSAVFLRLQDTTAQIRVRGAFLLLIGLVALAEELGLEVILGAFLAGSVLTLVDRDRAMTHPQFRLKLEASGFGIFIPVFFVTSGIQYNAGALFGSVSTVVRVPLFLAALLVVRGLPAVLYRGAVGTRRAVVAGLLQATSLPFIVAASMIGLELGLLDRATGAALIAAGLLSVLLFPLAALTILRGAEEPRSAAVPGPIPPLPTSG